MNGSARRLVLVRVLVVLTVLTGLNYVTWRWLDSVAWSAWWIAVPLVLAETYSLVDTLLFGVTMWRVRDRGEPPPAPAGTTVDVFVTTYDEPQDLVLTTARAARDIRYPHRTWILDDGARPALRAAAEAEGIGYLTRSASWDGKPRHAKAGNLNDALFRTEGELVLVLDADQVPDPAILDRTVGYFVEDERVAIVQTPQYFTNVDEADPLGSQAPLFYGPIQQGKDGWNAAFFCGSNAVLRREALMQLGVVGYVRGVTSGVRRALRTADAVLARAARSPEAGDPAVRAALDELQSEADGARRALRAGEPVADVTYRFQCRVDAASRTVVAGQVETLRAELAAVEPELLRGGPLEVDAEIGQLVVDEDALDRLARRDLSPLVAVEAVRRLADAVDVGIADEAQAVMPMATISVTEDMATAMRLHSLGWRSVYHHEVLAHGLAPEDMPTMLQQRLRWAQGTVQVMLRENPLVQRGLSLGQRLMYFSTMWSYLAGFAALAYLAAPVVYLCFGILPVQAFGTDFFVRFVPYFLVNQLLFLVVARGVRTWRGQQYSLALFPVWIRACWTAFANVVLGRPLGFVVTPKTRTGEHLPAWRTIWPQLTAMVVLVVAAVVGTVRLVAFDADPGATVVTLLWVVYDLAVLGVLVPAARYAGPRTPADTTPGRAVPATPRTEEQ
ncbi:glycosyltransferase family 2 protein [Cellulosimicrobium cellulans]|uniref:glycosyltransferase family 2 protein n=1 Tax=Cellulosimicrobium cellulans TaxID=1710 RepID=UPI00084944DA|nr:glycosyltransferase family 2 protein [Cellulosimicrobium cellulans]